MTRYPRKTAPGVKDGKVQRKNRTAPTPNFYDTPQRVPALDRWRPGPGHRHLLRKRDIVDFVSILPDWEELSKGLNVVLLATAEDNTAGWCDIGVVAVCAWPRTIWMEVWPWFYEQHGEIYERLGVPCRRVKGAVRLEFTEATARAFQLVHILLHELGHHHDRMTNRSKFYAARGEGYAEDYANRYMETIWDRYTQVFDLY
jgi:hypothetical protein